MGAAVGGSCCLRSSSPADALLGKQSGQAHVTGGKPGLVQHMTGAAGARQAQQAACSMLCIPPLLHACLHLSHHSCRAALRAGRECLVTCVLPGHCAVPPVNLCFSCCSNSSGRLSTVTSTVWPTGGPCDVCCL